MSNASDFIIENGVLREYHGSGGDVVIPEGVRGITNGVFHNCQMLRSISLPKSLTYIGDGAFANCQNLQNVTFPDSLNFLGWSAFSNCTALKAVRLPGNLQEIRPFAFSGCSSLDCALLSDGIKKVCESAFEECTNLQAISFPRSLICIERSAFACCRSLKTLNFPENLEEIGWNAFYACKCLTEVKLPAGLKEATYAFHACHQLESVVIPDGVQAACASAFPSCTAFEKHRRLLIQDGVLLGVYGAWTDLSIPEGVATINDSAFSCTSERALQTLTIPETVQKIGADFCGFPNLKTLNVPESVTEIGKSFLCRCESLRSVVLPRNLRNLPEWSLMFCESLRHLVAPGISFAELKERRLVVPATIGYLCNPEKYADQASDYQHYANRQKKRLVPVLLANDWVTGIATYAANGQITKANFESTFFDPALEVNATQCIAFLLDWKDRYLPTKAYIYRI